MAFAIAMLAFPMSAPVMAQSTGATPSPTIVPGELLVKLRPGTSEQTRSQTLEAVQGVFVRSLDQSDLILAKVPIGSEMSAAQSLQIDPNVVFAEPNGRMEANAQ